MCPFIRGLHDAGTATTNNRKAGIRKFSGNGLGELIVGVFRQRTGGAKNGYRRRDAGESLKSFHEFSHDLENFPRLTGKDAIIERLGPHVFIVS